MRLALGSSETEARGVSLGYGIERERGWKRPDKIR